MAAVIAGGINPAPTSRAPRNSAKSALNEYTLAKLHDANPERLRARIRELTEECRRLREELGKSTKDRLATNPLANDDGAPVAYRRGKSRARSHDLGDVEKNTIVIDRREGLWRMRVYPDRIQFFRSRELAEAHAQEVACSQMPRWTVIVREQEPG